MQMKIDAKRGRAIEIRAEGASSHPQIELTGKILECPLGVHNALGAGFLERVYSNALACELRTRGLNSPQKLLLKVNYKGAIVGDCAADIIAEDAVLDANHRAQTINCLRAFGIRVGLLLNFRRPTQENERFVDSSNAAGS
jgi:GxxExxY protein